MPRKAKSAPANVQPGLLEAHISTAPCVPAIREALKQWREDRYKGVTETTRTLLNYWFRTDHRLPDGRKFEYHYFQRDAIEALIYLYEVARVRRHKSLLERYATTTNLRLLQYDDFARYCVKMATGSGKTKVMALAMVWQYLNAAAEAREDYAKTFLLIAPNVIVYERLKTDFAGGHIFRVDPLIPPELSIYWDLQCYMRDEGERASSQGALYLTNIHQLYERPDNGNDNEPDVMTAVMGSKPPANTLTAVNFDERILARRGPLVVLNDEAHHTHDEESEWNKCIRQLHDRLVAQAATTPNSVPGIAAQLDFTATPRHSKGALFTWTVYDYPLKQAIIDNVVKRPLKGITSGIKEQPSQHASVKYRAYLTAGFERWREYRDQLKPLNKKPVLFVMMNDTTDADEVGEWLQTRYASEFGGSQLLIIHTDKTGEVSKKDLELARKASREVDDETSPINCIVSVLMLREGWDVQNVTVIVGLRPYTSKAAILPEQTIGRGLRLMFRRSVSDYRERVDVIGNKTFIQFVEQLEHDENMELETFEVGKDKLEIVTIMPDPAKQDKDIALPVLSPILARKKSLGEEIAALDVSKLACPRLPYKQSDVAAQQFRYEGYDFLTLQKLVERDYTIPEPQTAEEVIGYYARRIAQDLKLPSQFAALVPKVREFFETRAFGEHVALNSPAVIKAMSSNVANFVTVKTFVQALREMIVEELQPQLLGESRRLSETPAFPYSRPTLQTSKTVFNLVACDNEFEKEFGKFLEDAPDVERFAKLPERFGFTIEYTDAATNLRYYEPDFVVVTKNGKQYLVETKGQMSEDVPHKNRAARLWCENATILTGVEWEFVIVRQSEYNRLRPDEFGDLGALQAQLAMDASGMNQ